ncbi:PilZ domain-containing protein [Paenibacillus alkaliterrae]|uniref:PilZ domain-containing protein n=1 Tax=Paenibacillus alkaliterrae TaxID=320909 RepID=UPI001F21FCC8|nr:PilZ domain-containing protein [Paenibacillus alkaliterrae]MCF2937781.1 PilZ domain-containing protein [Paenibacillus alkaliterrae]
MATNPMDDPRNHIRLRFIEGVKAELRLVSMDGEPLTSSTSTVLLLNMSQNGLCFLSGLQLPVQRNYRVQFRMKLSRTQIIVRGRIVWCSKNDNQFVHGVLFECSDTLRSLIIGAMNEELLGRQPQQQKIHNLYSRLLHKSKVTFEGYRF